MISSINIKNIALIQELTVELSPGLNILSGETGAGKSIIIDSLNFVLGDRAIRSLIRYGEDFARVEVVFTDVSESVFALLKELGIDNEDDYIIINRIMTAGKSECRINGRMVNLAVLRQVVGMLVDVHSQNEAQSLMKVSNHIKLLDEYNGKILPFLAKFRKILDEYKEIEEKLKEFTTVDDRERRLDILHYQADEIKTKIMREGEEEELTKNRARYYNMQKIVSAIGEAVACLESESGFGGVYSISKAENILSSIAKFDEEIGNLAERLDVIKIEAKDILSSLEDKLSGRYEDVNIEVIEKRLDEIRMLKKKYGGTIDEINQFLVKAEEQIDFLENAEAAEAKLRKKSEAAARILIDGAKALHEMRAESAERFSREILTHLSDLGMKNTVFEILTDFPADDEQILAAIDVNGADSVEFMLSPNAGEPVKPLVKIASGGEMSRFMLALKNVIAETDQIATLVFDEIDTGISGKIAKEVAMKLYNIARSRQVLAVTHLPQLASMGDRQYLIKKNVTDGKTLTSVYPLGEHDMLLEIMRLAGSADNSEIGLSHAKELKKWADDYKASV